ncbi:hypothetical protein [Nitrosomonas marina]|uniref:Lipoprotein n=1 Tax=Nitrosomonas marina TaxID=917 RepID=A0A1H8EWZ1_9PROT|nr:hypothetical protein [Nitrosomonas marina]SEN23985.1 hypothetical protein SAMN05216325_1114 [Nitrosomonas marina]
MHARLIIASASLLIITAGCAGKEQFYRSMYEGWKTQETNIHPRIDQRPLQHPQMSYDAYDTERKNTKQQVVTIEQLYFSASGLSELSISKLFLFIVNAPGHSIHVTAFLLLHVTV